jgi:tetratricopeptide (TPR) repeat protein
MRYQALALTTCMYALALMISWGAAPAPAQAAASPAGVDIPAVLKQTRDYQLRFRDGELDVVTANVALLEQATAAETGNADLWHALGVAYVYLAARATLPGGNRGDLMFALQKGMPALNRALQIDPDHAEALAVRAGMRALMGRGMNQPQLVSQALSDMNRAVELAPKSVSVRLTRAFGGPAMPEELRNRANEAADLDFLIEVAEWNRAGNFMTILRADLYFENGELDSARQLYQTIEGTGAASAAQLAKSRLARLAQGKEPMMKDILALRAVAGTQCSMCHGR